MAAEGEAGLTRRNAAMLDASGQAARLGSLTVRVMGDAPLRVVRSPFVHLLTDTTARDRVSPVRTSVGDTLGITRWDALPAGRYGLLVRQVGFQDLRRAVDVRAGGADTLLVTLRTYVTCHAP